MTSGTAAAAAPSPSAPSSHGSSSTTTTPTRSTRHRRQDLNHLLGFYAAPRAVQPTFQPQPRRSAKRTGAGAIFNRERFVNAQMRFVLTPTGDYTAHHTDPDIYFEWQDVLQVIIPTCSALSTASASLAHSSHTDEHYDHTTTTSSFAPACPICLTAPNASRMSRCGHVFCFGCVLHYLALADGTRYRKCPVCYDPIYAKDLKSVKWFDLAAASSSPISNLTVSSTHSSSTLSPAAASHTSTHLRMRLMQRPPLTTLALPRSPTWPSDAVQAFRTPWTFTPDVLTFAKFMLGAPEYLKLALEEDLKELEKEVIELRSWGSNGSGTDDELGITFVRAAMEKVRDEIRAVEELAVTTSVMMAKKVASKELKSVEEGWERRESERRLRSVLREAGEEEVVDSNGGSTTATTITSSSEVEDEAIPVEFLLSRYATGLSSSAVSFAPSSPLHSAMSATSHTNSASSSSFSTPPTSISSPSSSGSNSTNIIGHHSNATSSSNSSRRKKNVNPAPPTDSTFFYYQAASGQSIFLDALDTRILKAYFGSYDSFPDTISVPLEGLDEGSMTEDLRRKYHYLAHLPRATDVVFVEVDLGSIVSGASVEPFAATLKQRRAKRRDKGRREDKAKMKSEQREVDNRPTFPTSEGSSATYVYSKAISYTAVPYEGFMESSNFPRPIVSKSAAASTSIATGSAASPPTNATTVWGTRSMGDVPPSRRAGAAGAAEHRYEVDEDYDERWEEFEGSYNNSVRRSGGGGNHHRGGASSGSKSGGGANSANVSPAITANGGKKKKAKKLVLSLTSGRGTG